MPLTQEQIKALKKQLAEQIQHLPPEQQEQAHAQIEQMSPESLEILLKESQQKEKLSSKKQESPYRMIINKELSAVIVDENSHSLAVLEIRPISKGHMIIIPKSLAKTAKDIPTEALNLAKKLAKRAIANLKTQSAEIATQSNFGETIINVIPIYDAPLSLSSLRSQATQEELEKLAQKLKPEKKAPKPIKIKPLSQQGETLKLPRRIP